MLSDTTTPLAMQADKAAPIVSDPTAADGVKTGDLSLMLASKISDDLMGVYILEFLQRKCILNVAAVDPIVNHFHLKKYYCVEHGTRLEKHAPESDETHDDEKVDTPDNKPTSVEGNDGGIATAIHGRNREDDGQGRPLVQELGQALETLQIDDSPGGSEEQTSKEESILPDSLDDNDKDEGNVKNKQDELELRCIDCIEAKSGRYGCFCVCVFSKVMCFFRREMTHSGDFPAKFKNIARRSLVHHFKDGSTGAGPK